MTSLLQSGDRALDWVAGNLAAFDPLGGPVSQPSEFRIIALGELALLSRTLHRHRPNDHRLERCFSLLAATWERREYTDWLLHRPFLLPVYLATWAALRDEQGRQPNVHAAIQAVLADGYPILSEQWPSQRLELRYRLDALGIPHHLPSYRRLYMETALSKPLPTRLISDSDSYCITHAIFYLMDPFFPHEDVIPRSHIRRIRDIVGELLGLSILEGNLDLVIELLICCHYLRWLPRHLVDAGVETVLEAQLPNGRIPPLRESASGDNAVSAQRPDTFSSDFHPTLLWAETSLLLSEWDVPS
jgi:hypothetical protein